MIDRLFCLDLKLVHSWNHSLDAQKLDIQSQFVPKRNFPCLSLFQSHLNGDLHVHCSKNKCSKRIHLYESFIPKLFWKNRKTKRIHEISIYFL